MFPDQTPGRPPSDDPQDDFKSGRLPGRDEQCSRAPIWESSLFAIKIQPVSAETFKQVLSQLIPEIPSSLAEYLFGVLEKGETVDANELLSSYFHEQLVTIFQTRSFGLGGGTFAQHEHLIKIVRHDQHEILPVHLQAPPSGESGVTLRVHLSWLDKDARWNLSNQIGDVLGQSNIADLLWKATAEKDTSASTGVVTTPLTSSIFLETCDESITDSQDTDPDLASGAPWAPRIIQCANLMYGERHDILTAIMPQHAAAILRSGVLNTAENFTENHAACSEERLQRISEKLSQPIEANFRRVVYLGDSDEAVSETSADADDDLEDRSSLEIPEADGCDSAEQPDAEGAPYEEDMSLEDDEEDVLPFETPDEEDVAEEYQDYQDDSETADDTDQMRRDEAVESSVIIRGIPSLIGNCRITYRTRAEPLGGTHLIYDEFFDFDAHTLGIEFEEGELETTKKVAKNRWRLVKRLGDILKSPLDMATIRSNLSFFNDEPDSCRYGIDLTSKRLAIFIRK